MLKTLLYDKNNKEIKLGDKIKLFKVGHKSFEATVYYGQAMIREDVFGRCLWDYTLSCLGENIINCVIL